MISQKVLLCLTIVCFCKCNRPILKQDKNLHGQTAPPDMVFVEGKGKIPSFYIGVSEEPNINYVAYLNWLRAVYVDYPEVAENAKITEKKATSVNRFNDPALVYHMEHAAFAYYPIVGATWYQIQDYLQWKTDRINEAILIELDLMGKDPNSFNEENFNLEAYLYEQYSFNYRQKIKGFGLKKIKNSRTVAWKEGIVTSGLRLPTEAEWELLSEENTKNARHSKYPYGKNYPLLHWADQYYSDNYYLRSNYSDDDIPQTYRKHWNKGIIPNPKRYKNYAQGIQGPYLNNRNQLPSNIAGNVKEWLLDEYNDTAQTSWNTMQEYYSNNGFETNVQKIAPYDEDGVFNDKDALGRLPFRIMGVNTDGSPMWVKPPNYNRNIYKLAHDTTKAYLDEKELQYVASDFETFFIAAYPRLHGLYNRQISNHSSAETTGWVFINGYLSTNNFNYDHSKTDSAKVYKYAQANWKKAQVLGLFGISTRNWKVVYKDEKGLHNRVIKSDYRSIEVPNNNTRLIRGGTWQNPNFNNRESMPPDSASTDVGFRCVLPYTSIPVQKKYKMKWK